jgi:hypothetical protein
MRNGSALWVFPLRVQSHVLFLRINTMMIHFTALAAAVAFVTVLVRAL